MIDEGVNFADDGEQDTSAEFIQADFNKGLKRGSDPNNLTGSGPARTTSDSDWFQDYCEICEHNFRLDDKVVVTLDQANLVAAVRHDGQPWCGSNDAAVPVDPMTASAFFAAIDEADPPTTEYLLRLLPGHPLLSQRQAARARDRRYRCMVCRNTFRPFEFVVICVCSPAERVCALTVHRDAAHNLYCYDDLVSSKGDNRIQICPMNHRVVP